MITTGKAALSALGVFVLVVVLYLPTLRGQFVYDSIAQVLYSDYIHDASHWPEVLTLRVVGKDELDRNRPLHLASLMLDAAIWGKQPFGYRLTSVLLHALNAALLCSLIALLLRGPVAATASSTARANPVAVVAAVFGALLFALHPLVVEAVAEPSNREDLLVLFAVLVGLNAIAAPLRTGWTLNLLLAACSLLSVAAKESGAAAPFVFAAACLMLGRLRRCGPGLSAGFFAVCAFLAASYLLRPTGSVVFTREPPPLAADWASLLAVQTRIWTLQLSQIFCPWNLCAHYPPQSLAPFPFAVALVVLTLVAAAAVFVVRADRLAALGVAIYLLCLLPVSNFAAQYHPIADRYLYAPLAGLGLIAAVVFARAREKFPAQSSAVLLAAAAVVLLAAEYGANLRRQFVWQQPESLWTDALRQYPSLAQAHLGMANVHWRAGDMRAAFVSANDAVANGSGRWAEAYAMRALCEWQTGNRDAALNDFRQARSLSRLYDSESSAAAALFFSPPQLAILRELFREDAH